MAWYAEMMTTDADANGSIPRPKLATDTHARGEAPGLADKSVRLLNKRSEIGPGPVPSQVTFVGTM